VCHEIKRLVSEWFPLSGQFSDEIKRRDKHVVARLPLFSDAGSIPAASTNSTDPNGRDSHELRPFSFRSAASLDALSEASAVTVDGMLPA